MSTNCLVSWFLSEKCNYKCSYCNFGSNNIKSIVNRFIRHKKRHVRNYLEYKNLQTPLFFNYIDTIISNFQNYETTNFTFCFTGGEPFIYPNFNKLCTTLLYKPSNKIAIDTNLSVNIEKFIESIPAEKVFYICAAIHIMERERIPGQKKRFINNAKMLLANNYPITVPYVLHPQLINRFESDYLYFLDEGIKLTPKPFKGVFNKRIYPNSYDSKALSLLEKYCPSFHFPNTQKGKKCNAGYSLIRINSYGNIFRCSDDNTKLGNIIKGFELYNKPKECTAIRCNCYSPTSLFGNANAWQKRTDLQIGITN